MIDFDITLTKLLSLGQIENILDKTLFPIGWAPLSANCGGEMCEFIQRMGDEINIPPISRSSQYITPPEYNAQTHPTLTVTLKYVICHILKF